MAEDEMSPEIQGRHKHSIREPVQSIFKRTDPSRGEPTLDPSSDDMKRFTATGRPYVPDDSSSTTWAAATEDFILGGTGSNTLPVKYTDESLISVPCLRPRSEESVSNATGEKNEKEKWWRRISSRLSSGVGDSGDVVVRKMTRGEFLKHYSKDGHGNYAGTEEPAEDCILTGKDLEKYRGGK